MPKRVDYDKNPQSAEAHRKQNQAITQSLPRRIAQLQYRIGSIMDSVAAGRQTMEAVGDDLQRLHKMLTNLEAQSPA